MDTEQKSNNPINLKVILLGDMSVGKTSFVNRYITGSFTENSGTIGASFLLKTWNSRKIAIWDTSGEERFRGLSKFYCRGAGGVIMAFDLTNEKSFRSLRNEFASLLADTMDNCRCVVVGMKSDLVEGESKSRLPYYREEGTKLVEELNKHRSKESLYFETSSFTGNHVEDVFEALFKNCLPLMASNSIEDSICLKQDTNDKQKSCSC